MDKSFSLTRRQLTRMAAASAVAGVGLARAQDSRVILGQSAAFSGPSAQLGTQFHAGAKLWFDQQNAKGGVAGRNVEIRNLDDGYEPDRCVANTEKLIKDEVFALFGYIGTPTSLAALPLATSARVPFIAPFTGAMGLREPFKREAFHLRASYDDETALIVKQLIELSQNRIGVFYQNDAYGKAGLSGVTKALADELGKDGAGVVVSQVVPSPYNPARPVSREFVAAAKQQGRVQANFSSMEGYLAAKLFTEGLKRAGGKPTREALIAALESINEDFGGYRVSFGPGNHVASKFVELSMLTGDGRVRT